MTDEEMIIKAMEAAHRLIEQGKPKELIYIQACVFASIACPDRPRYIPGSLSASIKWNEKYREWLKYCRELKNGKKITDTTLRKHLKQMEAWGPDKSILAMETSMQKQWTGLFEPAVFPEQKIKSKFEDNYWRESLSSVVVELNQGLVNISKYRRIVAESVLEAPRGLESVKQYLQQSGIDPIVMGKIL